MHPKWEFCYFDEVTHRESLQPYYSAWLPCSRYRCNRCKRAHLLYVSDTPRARKSSFWCEAKEAWDILVTPLRRWVVEVFLDVDACSHRRAILRGTLWESLNGKSKIQLAHISTLEKCHHHLVNVDAMVKRPNGLKVVLHSLFQFLWHLKMFASRKNNFSFEL